MCKGPQLANTRWYGHLRQAVWVRSNIEKLDEAKRNRKRPFHLLDSLAVEDMAKTLTNVQKLGRILESECPYADLVMPTIRTLSNILDKWSREERIHQEARNFCARLYTTLSHIRRFGDFSTVFCAATLLSPSKDKRSALMPSEEERAKLYLEEMGRTLTTEEPHILQATVAESETIELIDDPIEDIF